VVDLAVLGLLDLMILEVLSNLNDSVILFYSHADVPDVQLLLYIMCDGELLLLSMMLSSVFLFLRVCPGIIRFQQS